MGQDTYLAKVIDDWNAAEQSVHLTGGILRHFRAFFSPEQNPAFEVLSRSAHPQVTQTVRRLCLFHRLQ